MQKENEQIWVNCSKIIRDNIGETAYNTWFAPLKSVSYENEVLVLQVPSTYFVEHIENNYIDLLQKVLYRVCGQGTKLEYRALVDKTSGRETQLPSLDNDTESKQNVSGQSPANPYKRTKLVEIDPQLNPTYKFSSLVEGNSNKLARTAGISISNDPGKTVFNPLFVWGQSGVGKTHLVNAIGLMTKQLHPEKRVLYVAANTFQLQYTDAVRNNTVNDFINFYQTIDVLIIDDIHEFATKNATQNTYFHIFNHLHQNGKQLIITSDRSPVVMAGMETRLLTRFKWGLNAEIEKPDFNMRKDILKNKIHRDGLEITEDVIDFIANNVTDNVRDLEGTLISLLAHSTLTDTAVDLKLAENVIGRIVSVPKQREITVEKIRDVVCTYFNLSVDAISTKSRKREVVQTRQIAMYLSRLMTKSPLSTIGSLIGKRDHATVLHAEKTVGDLMQIDKNLRAQIDEITKQITE